VKGYLFTALTTLMFLSLFMVTYYFFSNASLTSGPDISAEKTASIFDDIETNLAKLVGVNVRVNNSDYTVYGFSDRVPAQTDIVASVRNYSAFLQSTYSLEANAALAPDFTALSSSTQAVSYMIYPQGYSWGYSNLSKKTLLFKNVTQDAEPQALDVKFDYSGEGISDLIWLEAENFTLENGVVVEDISASDGRYVEDFTLMSTTVYVPLALNYTLWVRSVSDNSPKAFKVEVGGINSSLFDTSDPEATSPYFKWFNDSVVVFNMTPGDNVIRVYPDPASGTEAIDVILLNATPVDLPDDPLDMPLDDPFVVERTLGGNLSFDLTVLFANVNYTYSTQSLNRKGQSNWNFTFNDGDKAALTVGDPVGGGKSYSSLRLSVSDSVNGSSGTINASVTFPKTEGEVFVDSGASLAIPGRLSRADRLWLAKG